VSKNITHSSTILQSQLKTSKSTIKTLNGKTNKKEKEEKEQILESNRREIAIKG